MIYLSITFIEIGLSVRSVCWAGEKILVGTNSSEIYEVLASNKESPRTLVQVHRYFLPQSWL